MNLCIDIGNTKAKIALFEQDVLIENWSRNNVSIEWLEKQLADKNINAAILSSTRGNHPEILAYLQSKYFSIDFNHETHLPIQNHYATPQTLGRDRIAAVCGAQFLYPNQNVLVIDAGTCITLDAITKNGDYYGGSIHPGISMRFKALNNYTGKLPLVKRQNMHDFVGDSTENSILVGVVFATIKEIEGMMSEYKVKYGELIVIITGGDASFFESQMKSKIFAHSNLVLAGLNKILNYNVEKL
jgi:type III pantothenate kinase